MRNPSNRFAAPVRPVRRVWKLPMRNPSWATGRPQERWPRSLEATYEESKLLVGFVQDQEAEEFGSYL